MVSLLALVRRLGVYRTKPQLLGISILRFIIKRVEFLGG
jgi:hypothetical protein